MPFVKRNSTQTQHDAQKLFIGREGELLFFVQNILTPEEPAYNIISISGQGGVGKSTLLTRFMAEVHSGDFEDYCLAAVVDERQFTPLDIMEKFAKQLHITGNFEKALKRYKEALSKSQAEQETTQDIVLRKVPDFAGATVEGVPLVGPLLREGISITTELLVDKYRTLHMYKDKELLENPIDDLTHAFVEELNQLTDAQVMASASQEKRHRRIILCFDTFEQLASVAAPWLLDYFLLATISTNVVLVTAGRDSIEYATPDGPKPWLPYLDNHTIYPILLDSFTENETRIYLAQQGITDADQVSTIQQLSGGLPLYLALLTSNPLGRIDPTKDVVINFLRWIPEQEPLKRQLALDAALFSRPFDRDDLEVFTYVSEAERPDLYQWLIELSFVRTSPLDGRHRYHDLVQALFCRHLHQRSRKEYYATRKMLANHYKERLEKLQTDLYKPHVFSSAQGRPTNRSEEWQELTLAIAYQLFLLPSVASHREAIELILQSYEDTHQTAEMLRVLHKLIQEQPHNLLRPSVQHLIELLFKYIEADRPDAQWQALLTASDKLLKALAREASFSPELLAYTYRKRGFAYKMLRQYQLAIEDYNHTIELYPTYARAYANRGSAYRSLKEYEHAIDDYSKALTYRENYAWAYTGRGQTYSLCQDYSRAIQDFDHTIEIEPNYGLAYFWRGYTYLRLQDRVQARADFAQSWALRPQDVRSGWMIVWFDMDRQRPTAAMIEHLAKVAASDALSYWTSICRSIELWWYNYFEAAHALLTQVISAQPEEADGYFWQGMNYVALEQYPAAAAAIENALASGMPPMLLRPLYWFELDKPDFYRLYAVPLLNRYDVQ